VVWLLAEVDGLAFAEIAEVVGTSEQAVRGRLFRARTRLAELMRAWR
jgi:RNA polymerase sigma-70 factor (ECF subfamily)